MLVWAVQALYRQIRRSITCVILWSVVGQYEWEIIFSSRSCDFKKTLKTQDFLRTANTNLFRAETAQCCSLYAEKVLKNGTVEVCEFKVIIIRFSEDVKMTRKMEYKDV